MRKSFFVVLLCISLQDTTAASGTGSSSRNPLACWLDRILKARSDNEEEMEDAPLPEAQAIVPIVETKSKRESTTALAILGCAVGDGLRLVGGLWLLVEVLDALGCIIPTEDQASNNKNNAILQGLAWMQAQSKSFRSKTLPRIYNQVQHVWHTKFVQASPKHRFGIGAFLGSIFVSNGGLFEWICTTILWPLGLVYAVSEVYVWSKLRFWMTWYTLSVADERHDKEVDDWDFGSLIRDLQKRAGNNDNSKSLLLAWKRIGHWLDRSIEGFRFQVRKGMGYMLGLSLQDMMLMDEEDDEEALAYWDARVEDLLLNHNNSPSSSTLEKDIAWMSVGGGDDNAHPLQLAFWKLKEQLHQLQQELSSFQQQVADPELAVAEEPPSPPKTTMHKQQQPLVGFRKGILVGILFGMIFPNNNNNQRRRPRVGMNDENDDNALSSSSSSSSPSWFSGMDMDIPLL